MSALRKLRAARLAIQRDEQQAASTSAIDAADAEDDDDIAAERQQRANVMQAAFSMLQQEDEEEAAEDEEDKADSSQQHPTVPANEAVSTSADQRLPPSHDVDDEDSEDEDRPSARKHARTTRRVTKQSLQLTKASRRQPAATRAKLSKSDKAPVEHEDEKVEDDEDIDSLVAELDQQRTTDSNKRAAGSRGPVGTDEADSSDWSFLATQQKHLDSNSEIRARFGSTAVRGVAAAEREGEEKAPRGMVRRRPQGAAVTAIARRQRLVKVGDDWPPMVDRGDLKMVRIDPNSSSSSSSRGLSPVSSSASPPPPSRAVWLLTSSSCPLFSFRYSSDYDRLQQEYLSAISSHDIQALLYFARQHPYHVDCCVQLSELSESQGEFIVAHAAIQRALHMYDLSLHREFDLYSGRCRLDGDVRENRGLFVALARHAQMLGKKGYSRTALEVCKLLLSLSPLLDPQCVALFIDYHAIRAHQFAWLLELPHRLDVAVVQMTRSQPPWSARKTDEQPTVVKDESKEEKERAQPTARVPAVVLPNLCYARAMAAYYIEQEDSNNQTADTQQPQLSPPSLAFLVSPTASFSSSSASTSLTTITTTSSAQLLHLAVLLYPEVVSPLLRQSGHEKGVDNSDWKPLLSRLSKLYPESKYVDKLVLVYTERSGVLWKNDALIAWLLRACQHIVHTLDTGTQSLAAFQQHRAALFPRNCPIPPAISQLQRTQFTDTVHRLPPEVLMAQAQAQAEGGMMEEDDEGAGIARMSLAELRAALQANRMEGLNVQGDNPLIALLRSLLPWNVVAPQMQQQRPQQQAGGEAEGQEDVLEEADEDDDFEEFDEEGEVEDIGEY